MRGRNLLVAALILTGAGPVVAEPPPAEPFRAGAEHFTVTPPRGWQPISAEERKASNSRLWQRNVECLAGFRRHADGLPLVIVAYQPGEAGDTSSDEWERAATFDYNARLKEVKGNFADVIKDVSMGEAGYDRARKRITFRVEATDVNNVPLVATGVGHIGAKGVVLLYFYTDGPLTARDLGVFERMNDSVRFDPGYEYTPAEQQPSVWNRLTAATAGGPKRPLLIGGAVTLGVVVVGGLTLAFQKKPARARAPW